MASLASQIMDCFDGNVELQRADLRFDAADDSVGRVLGKLVADKSSFGLGAGDIARPEAREQYPARPSQRRLQRRSDAPNATSSYARISRNSGSYDAIGRALRRNEKEGSLVQIGYGLYAKAERSPFTGRPAPVIGIKRLASEALSRLGKKTALLFVRRRL
jgi:hypothetical protein